jgi:outer membrane protein assembly factor BamA
MLTERGIWTRHFSLSAASRLLRLALGLAAAAPATAQEAGGLAITRSLYPLIYWQGSTGWTARGVLRFSAPVDPSRPEVNALDAGISVFAGTQGYRGVDVAFYAPGWVDGWRFLAIGRVVREARFGYYGLGNDTPRVPELVTDTSKHYYQMRRVSVLGRADVHRRLVGPLRVLVGLAFRQSEFSALPGPTLLGQQLSDGSFDPADLLGTAFAGRAGFVLDTRDNEFDPRRGILAELLMEGDGNFNRTTIRLVGVGSAADRLRFAGRVALERMDGDWPFSEIFWIETAWTAFTALGGYYTHRGLSNNRFAGPGKLLLSGEARYHLIRIPTLFELVGVAFVDAGRVFDEGTWSVTVNGLHWGGGAGIAVKFYRSTIFGVTFGASADGVTGDLGFGWSY